jgi:pilus assembly protein Flp/PilA
MPKIVGDCITKSRQASDTLSTGPSTLGEEQVMRFLAQKFLKDESGATAIEYGLIAAGISVAIIAVVNGVGSKVSGTFSSIQSQMK